MKKKISMEEHACIRRRSRRRLVRMLVTTGLFLGAGFLQSCEKDILTGQPEWLGNSIYERLQEGIETNDKQHRTFKITLNLIKDLGYEETLSRTGSKTLFVTPDDVFEKWFEEKGITYADLSDTQKKQLFHSSMINNAYLLNLMSNVTGNPPEEGSCMRREAANTIYDSISVIKVAEMPVNPMGDPEKDVWAEFIEEGKPIYICKDATPTPMIHFLPAFMEKNNITDEDLKIISNGESNTITDSWVSGKKVISKEQTCKNGYIYVVDGVIEGSSNMAQAIHNEPTTKMWAQALDRYSCPEKITGVALQNFQTAYNTQEQLYQLKYFTVYKKPGVRNDAFLKGGSLENEINGSGALRFDPGWNQYQVPTSTQTMAHDAAVMIVPTDEAVTKWLNEGAGKDLKERFGSWENIDYETLAKLINVNMLESFVSSVPSKFSSVLDFTSQRELGIKKEDIVKCIMCCNGVVYIVNQVYSPDSYDSVIYPAELQTNGVYSVINHALTGFYSTYSSANDFSPYLASMESRFALIIPYNTTTSQGTNIPNKSKVFRIIDPCSYGLPTQRVIEFYYSDDKVQGMSYEMTSGLQVPTGSGDKLSEAVVQNRLYDLIDNNIIVGDIVDGQEYYKTKTGGILRAYKKNGKQYIDGGYQIEMDEPLVFPDTCIVHKGNGVTYGASSAEAMEGKIAAVPMSATKSVYQLLKEEKTDTLFCYLLSASDLLSTKEGSYEPAGNDNKNFSIFDSYNYTVYVPQDSKIKELIDKGYLPTWKEYDELEEAEERGDDVAKKKREVIKNRINNFLRYHIQDNSVLINGDPVSQSFETGKLNPKNNRFYTLDVKADAKKLTVKGNVKVGDKEVCNVVEGGNFYNKLAREYWISSKGTANAMLMSSSYAVVHKIDGVLIYDASQLTSWEEEARSAK